MAELFQTHASKSQRLWSAVRTPSSQRVFSRQALKQVPTAGFPARKSIYLQLEILYFHTSMMDSMNLKADTQPFLQESRFNENTLKQNVKETCWVLERLSAFDPSWIWNFSAHHESSFWGSAWFGSNLLHLHGCSWNAIWPWSHSRHGKSMVFQLTAASSFFFGFGSLDP